MGVPLNFMVECHIKVFDAFSFGCSGVVQVDLIISRNSLPRKGDELAFSRMKFHIPLSSHSPGLSELACRDETLLKVLHTMVSSANSLHCVLRLSGRLLM